MNTYHMTLHCWEALFILRSLGTVVATNRETDTIVFESSLDAHTLERVGGIAAISPETSSALAQA